MVTNSLLPQLTWWMRLPTELTSLVNLQFLMHPAQFSAAH